MDPVKKTKIINITLSGEESILFALKRMDILERKLLIILNGSKFLGLLSVGAIPVSYKHLTMPTIYSV